MWYPRIAAALASAVAALLLYTFLLNIGAYVIWAVEYAATWNIDKPFVLVGTMISIVLLATIFVIGIGGVMASYGIKASAEGGYEFRDNWFGSWLNNRPKEARSFCELSMNCIGRLIGAILGTTALLCILAAIAYMLYLAPLSAGSLLAGIVLFCAFLAQTSSTERATQQKAWRSLAGLAAIIGAWSLYGLWHLDWRTAWTQISNEIGARDLQLLAAIGIILGILLAVMVLVTLFQRSALYAKICPMQASTKG